MKMLSISRVTPTDADLEGRRAFAMQLSREGRTQTYIANRLKVNQTTVCRWLQGTQRARPGKTIAVTPMPGEKPQQGRAPFVTDDQLREIQSERPNHHWTGAEFKKTIREKFGIMYSLGHCCALLKYLREEKGSRFDVNRPTNAAKARTGRSTPV